GLRRLLEEGKAIDPSRATKTSASAMTEKSDRKDSIGARTGGLARLGYRYNIKDVMLHLCAASEPRGGKGETMLSHALILVPSQGQPPAIVAGSGRKARDRIGHFLRAAIDNDKRAEPTAGRLDRSSPSWRTAARTVCRTSALSTSATISTRPRPMGCRPPPSSSTWPPSACCSTTW